MASEAEVKQKLLDEELAKPHPDPDVLYYLQRTQHLWNTVDIDRMRRGASKVVSELGNDTLSTTLDRLAYRSMQAKREKL
jgi:hypothetical protein